MEQFSAYWLDPTHGWMATHRLPLDSAILYCKEYRRHEFDCPVAIVPDTADPTPYLRVALGLPHYGGAAADVEFFHRSVRAPVFA
jgi:hypothetical protein